MRIGFFGTPHFAVPSLKMLVSEGYNVVGVFCQPDRKSGRGHKVSFSPVKETAIALGLPVFQFEKIKSAEAVKQIEDLELDLMITAAYGQILSQAILDAPKKGCINVHASLLPKYRGAAPIQWAIINGETSTGVTTMFTDIGLDTGDMLQKRAVPIGREETGGELYERLAVLGADVLKDTLEALEDGTLVRTPQKEEEATYFPMLNKDMAKLDFSQSAKQLVDRVRALHPIMRCYASLNGMDIKLIQMKQTEAESAGKPGEVLVADPKKGLTIQTGKGAVEVIMIQYPGGKAMEAKASLLGKPIAVGDVFE
ncbi:MAG: methionyl-tRNA formyltransferase [Eubacteriales bacterium]